MYPLNIEILESRFYFAYLCWNYKDSMQLHLDPLTFKYQIFEKCLEEAFSYF